MRRNIFLSGFCFLYIMIEKEEFRDIKGYEGHYQVSNFGNVKSYHTNKPMGRILKPATNSVGYLFVVLYDNNRRRTYGIHQLIAMAFLGHKPDGHKLLVNHKDGNKLNNSIGNLEVVTQRQNLSRYRYDKDNLSSKYTGVSWANAINKWKATICSNYKDTHLGFFEKEYDAHIAYETALKNIGNKAYFDNIKPKFTSKYKGVSWNKPMSKWRAMGYLDGKYKHIGYFNTEIEAHEAYKEHSQNNQTKKQKL